jgi:valyl-tRNA synthetase
LQDENETEEIKKEKQYILLYALENILKIMHPFIPFVTEEI